MGYLVRAYYNISPTRYYKDDSCWSADLKSKTTEDIISMRSFMEVLVLNQYQMASAKQMKVIQEFQKKYAQMDMTTEIMLDAINDALDKDEAKDETVEFTNQLRHNYTEDLTEGCLKSSSDNETPDVSAGKVIGLHLHRLLKVLEILD
ncbi:hypothetical protein Tco_1437902 [Tanacetum coccineum]